MSEPNHVENNMKTLIIHPADPSTSFLEIVYESVQDKTLITGGVSKGDLIRLISL